MIWGDGARPSNAMQSIGIWAIPRRTKTPTRERAPARRARRIDWPFVSIARASTHS